MALSFPSGPVNILDRLRPALKAHDTSVRLVVPTATMAQHLRHLLAREGYVVRPKLITTLARFAIECGAEIPASDAALAVAVARVLERGVPAEFSAVAGTAGFASAVGRLVEEFVTAGVGLGAVERYHRSIGVVYRDVLGELGKRGLRLRADVLRKASEDVRNGVLRGVDLVIFDGFFALSPSEREFVEALGGRADVIVTQPGVWQERPGLSREVFRAATVDREAEEIARLLLEERAAGRLWRECGVVVRTESYQAPLGAALARFGIPARFYFDPPLDEVPAVRRAIGAVRAMLGGWDYAETLAVLRGSGGTDRLDFEVRKLLPGSGLEVFGLHAEAVRSIEEWRGDRVEAAEWSRRFAGLAPEWEAACAEAAVLSESGPIECAEFLRTAETVARLTKLRGTDVRRDVVHVMSVYEARQWELPVVFVCGLMEKQFPVHASRDPLLTEASRRALGLRTVEEREREERFLFDLAASRATERLVLSWAESGTRGGVSLRSSFLDEDGRDADEWVRPRPVRVPGVETGERFLAPVTNIGPSALERFAACPFKFFAHDKLKLRSRPPRADERMDFSLRGLIVHEVLAACARAEDVERTFDRLFEAASVKKHVTPGYNREYWRQRMLDDLHRFYREMPFALSGEGLIERWFDLPMGGGYTMRGRIDRVEPLGNGASMVVDYKYSNKVAKKVTNADLLQGPLYTLAAERVLGVSVGAMVYVALRDSVKAAGWAAPGVNVGFATGPLSREWVEDGERRAGEIVERIRAGEVAVAPVEPKDCRFCDYGDVCRYDRGAAALAEAAE